MFAAFNRTSMESKRPRALHYQQQQHSFNRTSMESKPIGFGAKWEQIHFPFNRTSMESKPNCGRDFLCVDKPLLLIEPVWNQNILLDVKRY